MGIAEADLNHARVRFPSLRGIYGVGGRIDRAAVQIKGIVGGRSSTPAVYTVIVTFDNYPTSPPTAWVQHPPDSEIRHMNVFCTGGALNLPHVCMGNYSSIWGRLPQHERTLLHFLLAVHHVLNEENPSNPARR